MPRIEGAGYGTLEGPKVLFMDDEEDFLETLSKRLWGRGIKAQGHAEAQKALEALRREKFFAVVLDLRMFGKGGLSECFCALSIRKKYSGQHRADALALVARGRPGRVFWSRSFCTGPPI